MYEDQYAYLNIFLSKMKKKMYVMPVCKQESKYKVSLAWRQEAGENGNFGPTSKALYLTPNSFVWPVITFLKIDISINDSTWTPSPPQVIITTVSHFCQPEFFYTDVFSFEVRLGMQALKRYQLQS